MVWMMGLVQFHPAGFGPIFWGDDRWSWWNPPENSAINRMMGWCKCCSCWWVWTWNPGAGFMLWIPSSDGSDKSRIEWKFLVHSLQLRMVWKYPTQIMMFFQGFRMKVRTVVLQNHHESFFWGVEMVETEGCREQRRTRLASITLNHQFTCSFRLLDRWGSSLWYFFLGGGAIIFSSRGWFDDVFSYKKYIEELTVFFFQNPPTKSSKSQLY